jgi:hypothetical protein
MSNFHYSIVVNIIVLLCMKASICIGVLTLHTV